MNLASGHKIILKHKLFIHWISAFIFVLAVLQLIQVNREYIYTGNIRSETYGGWVETRGSNEADARA